MQPEYLKEYELVIKEHLILEAIVESFFKLKRLYLLFLTPVREILKILTHTRVHTRRIQSLYACVFDFLYIYIVS